MDAQEDIERILRDNEITEYLEFDECINLSETARINEQPPQVQKYWLGRLAYELAIRNEVVKAIKDKIESSGLSDTPDMYKHETISAKEKALIVALDDYGFTAMPAKNVLKTEHASYPKWLEAKNYDKLNINTIKSMTKMLDIIDEKHTKRYYDMTNDLYNKIKNVGKIYTQDKNWLLLIRY